MARELPGWRSTLPRDLARSDSNPGNCNVSEMTEALGLLPVPGRSRDKPRSYRVSITDQIHTCTMSYHEVLLARP
jgi:hypothetical protein